MDTVEIINLPYISGIEKLPNDLIKRDAPIHQIIKILEQNDLLFIQGDKGVGKTTLLLDFTYQNKTNSISHFITRNYNYSHSFDCILENLYRQIYFYCYNSELEEDIIIDISFLNTIQSKLFKRIKNRIHKNETLFFVFDGFENLTKGQLEIISPIFDILPFGKAKFIFTGDIHLLEKLFGTKKIKSKEFQIMNFSINETKEYFKDFVFTDDQISDIHKLSDKGLPASLKEIKLLCVNYDGIEKFFKSSDIHERSHLFERHWDKVDSKNELQLNILSILAFNEIQLTITSICEILKIKKDAFLNLIQDLPFIEITENKIKFQTESLRSFSKRKLLKREDYVNKILIEYYESNSHLNDDNKYNLPNLYRNAKLWEKLTSFYDIDTFIFLLEKHQTLGNLNSQFNDGFEASKNLNTKFNESLLRFSLHKSTIKDIGNNQLRESEIEARIKLDQYDYALLLANSALLKEDRLKLLTIIAKGLKIKDQLIDSELSNQIVELYHQIDFSKIREKGFEISGLLIYSNLELAIDLVEKVSDNSASKNSLDYAFAHLMLYASKINKESKSQIADVDVLSSKIQSTEVKNLSNSLRFLSENYSFNELIIHVNNLSNFNQKLFLLKNWIINNKESEDAYKAVKISLEEIIKTSNENVPNASIFEELSLPILYINNKEKLEELIYLFDIHRSSVDRPTNNYIKLQLNIAEAFLKLDSSKAIDRIFDIYLIISELNDFSVKTDCLGLLWLWLINNDSDKIIESKLSLYETIEIQIRENLNLLLKDTAFHFKMVESLIISLVSEKPEFICEIIEKLNTQERRDFAYKLGVENYINSNKIENLKFSVIDNYYSKIRNTIFKEDVIILVIDKFYNEKEKSKLYLSKLIRYSKLISEITEIGSKCYVITKTISILSFENSKYNKEIEFLLKELLSSWEGIDLLWKKIEIGFLIARDIVDYSTEEAIKYLDLANDLKNNEITLSYSTITAYKNSLKLCIRSFCGIILIRDDYENEFNQLKSLINFIDSTGEKLKLWSELALKLYAMGKKDFFEQIINEYINPILFGWSIDFQDSYKSEIITIIAPSIYLNSSLIFLSEYFTKLTESDQNSSIDGICDFILTKLTRNDPVDEKKIESKINYTQVNSLLDLIDKFNSDYFLSGYIERIVDAIKKNRSEFTTVMTDSIKLKLRNIIDNKFPFKNGIKHEGYKIISEGEILTLEKYNEKEWDLLIIRANKIPNLSDRSLILILLANKLNFNKSKKKLKLMDDAFNLIKSIPSIYDKTNRFDATWDTFLDIDKGKFQQYIRLAYNDLLTSKDGEINGLRNLIDVAQQHDSKIAEEFINMLDDDPARKKLKEPFTKRLTNRKTIENVCDKKGSVANLNSYQFKEVSRKFIKSLNSNTMSTRDVNETFELIEKASNISLNDSFNAYMFFIQNAIKRFENNKKDPDILNSIFNVTYQNCRLIQILCSNNIKKMQNLYKMNDNNDNSKNLLIKIGKKEDANEYIKNWLRDSVEDNYYFIDPYFTENDLNILLWIKEISPNCQINILTSKKGGINSNISIDNPNYSTNKDVYINSWKKISNEAPVDTSIRIVWDKTTFDCPFHDRWYVAGEGNSCLYLGTSLNGLGNRESQITLINSEDELIAIKDLISKYFFRKERRVEKYHLKYEDFDLEY